MSIDGEVIYDDEMISSGSASPCSTLEKKRKQAPCGDKERSTKNSKKFKKALETCSSVLDSKLLEKQLNESKYLRQCESKVVDVELKPVSRSKMGKKIFITPMPVKRVMTIKPEKLKKKGNIWSKDCFPLPDSWLPHEDAILCDAVHEYGPNWNLVSEILYGTSTGGLYRGRYRHPVHCRERFRELVQKYVLSSAADAVNNDKACNIGSGKALLKVTEEHTRMLLDIATQLSDPEPLIQKHFFALRSSVWRNFDTESLEKMKVTNSIACGKLAAAALCDDQRSKMDDKVPIFKQRDEDSVVSERLGITLELLGNERDKTLNLPSVVSLSIVGHGTPPSSKTIQEENHIKSFQNLAENRFRTASRACLEDSLGWATLAFPIRDAKSRTPVKFQPLGKHKLSVTDSNKLSRSKLRKTAIESTEMRSLAADPVLCLVFSDLSGKHDVVSTSIAKVGINDLGVSSPFNINSELAMATDSSDLVAHEYFPGFIFSWKAPSGFDTQSRRVSILKAGE